MRQFLQMNIFRTSFSLHLKHCSCTYTYRHITANTVVLNVHVFVLLSSASILSSVAPASHLIHLTVWAPRFIVVWAYLDEHCKHMIIPQAEHKFRDCSMLVSQLQALCNVQQWGAEMGNGHVLTHCGPVTQICVICVFALQMWKMDDAKLPFNTRLVLTHLITQ
jgi:hypothetical protein